MDVCFVGPDAAGMTRVSGRRPYPLCRTASVIGVFYGRQPALRKDEYGTWITRALAPSGQSNPDAPFVPTGHDSILFLPLC
jgi:hypothetical protein